MVSRREPKLQLCPWTYLVSGNMNIWGWYRDVNQSFSSANLWSEVKTIHAAIDTRHVQGHYWSFGSRLDTILKCSCFQTLGMFNGTTEALVHVSMPSSSVHVSRHLACSRDLNLSGCLSRLSFYPRTTMFTTKASVVPLNMPSVWKHEHLRMVSRREPKLQ
jgi:hypothetical protein